MADTHETTADIIAEMRRGTRLPGYWHSCDVNKILQYHADRLDAAHRRERRLLKSCARWILCYDIYGHTAKELLAECKEVLNDDGQFLFKENEQ